MSTNETRFLAPILNIQIFMIPVIVLNLNAENFYSGNAVTDAIIFAAYTFAHCQLIAAVMQFSYACRSLTNRFQTMNKYLVCVS